VIQQRHGVQLKGGVGQQGDVYEQHADAVADLVVQGKSATGLLDTMAGGGAAHGSATTRCSARRSSHTSARSPTRSTRSTAPSCNATYDLGHHFKAGGGGAWNTKDAGMYDGPSIQGGNNSSNEFETTALAVDGAQKGEYYGSVKWGWKKDGSGNVSKVDFDIVSMGVPSKTFLAAATKWNTAKTRGTMEPVANGTKVLDPSLAEKFTIDTGVEVTYESSVSAGDVYYAFIRIKSDGLHKGETGYVKVSELKDKGDGAGTVDLPTVAVMVVTAQTPLYADGLQTKRLQSLAKDTRVKVLATKGVLKQIQIVDGPDTGKTGWAAADKLIDEA
jgi:hypothetical protein